MGEKDALEAKESSILGNVGILKIALLQSILCWICGSEAGGQLVVLIHTSVWRNRTY